MATEQGETLVRQMRRLRGFATSKEAAAELRISETYMRLLEGHHRRPGRDLSVRLQMVIGVPITYWATIRLVGEKETTEEAPHAAA